MHMGRKMTTNLRMQTGMMTHVNKISFTGTDTGRRFQGLRYTLMRAMGFHTQRIHHQDIYSFQQFIRSIRHRQHIRHISQTPSYPIPQNGQTTMHYLKRPYLRIFYKKRLPSLHFIQINARYSRIFVFHKTIGHAHTQMFSRICI